MEGSTYHVYPQSRAHWVPDGKVTLDPFGSRLLKISDVVPSSMHRSDISIGKSLLEQNRKAY